MYCCIKHNHVLKLDFVIIYEFYINVKLNESFRQAEDIHRATSHVSSDARYVRKLLHANCHSNTSYKYSYYYQCYGNEIISHVML